jgi:hypothetical protein
VAALVLAGCGGGGDGGGDASRASALAASSQAQAGALGAAACGNRVNLTALEVNADAVAYATLLFAMSTESVNGQRGKGNFSRPALKWLDEL